MFLSIIPSLSTIAIKRLIEISASDVITGFSAKSVVNIPTTNIKTHNPHIKKRSNTSVIFDTFNSTTS